MRKFIILHWTKYKQGNVEGWGGGWSNQNNESARRSRNHVEHLESNSLEICTELDKQENMWKKNKKKTLISHSKKGVENWSENKQRIMVGNSTCKTSKVNLFRLSFSDICF